MKLSPASRPSRSRRSVRACSWSPGRICRRFRRRRERSFEAYILQVASVERRALELSREPALNLAELLQMQDELARIKGVALEQFARGELDGEELMSGFLVHASDARDVLIRLILLH